MCNPIPRIFPSTLTIIIPSSIFDIISDSAGILYVKYTYVNTTQLSEENRIDPAEMKAKLKELEKLGLVQDRKDIYNLTGKGVQLTLILTSLYKLLIGDTKGWTTSLSTEYSRP